MKFPVALTLLATVAFHQVALAQEAGANDIPALPTPVTDIYWWKTLLTGSEINNYLTGPATEAATAAATADATADATAAAATPTADTTTDAQETSDAATASPTASVEAVESTTADIASAATSLASAESSLASALSDVSSSASDLLSSAAAVSTTSAVVVFSTPSVAASSWSSTYAAVPTFASASNGLPRASGSIIPPVTTSGAIAPSNSGALVVADLGKIVFSVSIAAVLSLFI